MNVIFDNIIFFLQRSGGGTVYWIELIKRASTDNSLKVQFSEPLSVKTQNNFRLKLPIKIKLFERLPLLWLRVADFSIPIIEKSIFHSSYYRISKSRNAINVVTIHDFTSEFYFSGVRKYIHQKRKLNALKHSDGIICISNNTKNDLLRLYPFIDKNKIRVIYNGVGDEYHIVQKSNISIQENISKILTEKYILYVGHRTVYKNFHIAIKAVSLLDKDFKLCIVGEVLSNNEIAQLNRLLPDRYCCLTGINNETLNMIYNYAYCLIYPSSYEGFGIPLVEAMIAGCPVITTNKSSIPEVVGDAAIMVDEISPANFVDSIQKLSDEKYKSFQIKKGLIQAAKFSWDKCYNEVKDFYTELYNMK